MVVSDVLVTPGQWVPRGTLLAASSRKPVIGALPVELPRESFPQLSYQELIDR